MLGSCAQTQDHLFERHAQRVEMPQRQQIKFSFEAPDDLHTRQRLGRGYAHDRRDQLVAQRARPAASMAKLDQQSEYALLASRVCPVVDQLTVHT